MPTRYAEIEVDGVKHRIQVTHPPGMSMADLQKEVEDFVQNNPVPPKGSIGKTRSPVQYSYEPPSDPGFWGTIGHDIGSMLSPGSFHMPSAFELGGQGGMSALRAVQSARQGDIKGALANAGAILFPPVGQAQQASQEFERGMPGAGAAHLTEALAPMVPGLMDASGLIPVRSPVGIGEPLIPKLPGGEIPHGPVGGTIHDIAGAARGLSRLRLQNPFAESPIPPPPTPAPPPLTPSPVWTPSPIPKPEPPAPTPSPVWNPGQKPGPPPPTVPPMTPSPTWKPGPIPNPSGALPVKPVPPVATAPSGGPEPPASAGFPQPIGPVEVDVNPALKAQRIAKDAQMADYFLKKGFTPDQVQSMSKAEATPHMQANGKKIESGIGSRPHATAQEMIADEMRKKAAVQQPGTIPPVQPQGPVTAPAGQINPEQMMLDAVNSLGPIQGVPVSTLRLRNALPQLSKEQFDQAALNLRKQQKVFLSLHADPYNISPADQDLLIKDPAGTYHGAVAIRK